MKGQDILFSSAKHDWITPDELFDPLNERYEFTLDVASDENNHKCDKYFTAEDDGLEQDWVGETTWCNPPFDDIAAWVRKNYAESLRDKCNKVLLIPARTDTKYFSIYGSKAAEMYFIQGRLKFSGSKNSAPFPSVVLVFNSDLESRRIIYWIKRDFSKIW